jgi:RHS repeat-associated protein
MTTTRVYDKLNRLQSITSTPSGTGEALLSDGSLYNDANQRVRTTLPDGSDWLYRYDTLGQVVSGKRDWSDGIAVAGQQFEYGFDGNGNLTGLINPSTGTNSAQYEYGPFGEVIRITGAMAKANPFRFSTKYQDDETDLLYYGFRYYNPSTGRWLSRDTKGERRGGAYLYGFVNNNSFSFFDPLRLQAVPIHIEYPPLVVVPPGNIIEVLFRPPPVIPPVGPAVACVVVAAGGWYLGTWIDNTTGFSDVTGDWLGGVILTPTGGATGTVTGSPFPAQTPGPLSLPLVNPSTCKCNTGCKPCPPNSRAWDVNEPGHTSKINPSPTHWHWIEYNQIPATYKGNKYKPCDCVPNRISSDKKPDGA